jgi:hypothetical protein
MRQALGDFQDYCRVERRLALACDHRGFVRLHVAEVLDRHMKPSRR